MTSGVLSSLTARTLKIVKTNSLSSCQATLLRPRCFAPPHVVVSSVALVARDSIERSLVDCLGRLRGCGLGARHAFDLDCLGGLDGDVGVDFTGEWSKGRGGRREQHARCRCLICSLFSRGLPNLLPSGWSWSVGLAKLACRSGSSVAPCIFAFFRFAIVHVVVERLRYNHRF
jgi:hypothetical protein